MPLEMGTRVGVYEVTGKLGEGGMGEVYRAHDTALGRDVALKVLSDSFVADPDRLVRFQREAKVLASLNHSNIGGIYGLENVGDAQALVLELIDGPTLADRINEGWCAYTNGCRHNCWTEFPPFSIWTRYIPRNRKI